MVENKGLTGVSNEMGSTTDAQNGSRLTQTTMRTETCQSLETNRGESYLLPCASAVGLAGAVHGALVLPQVDEGDSEAGEVRHVVVQ